MQLKLLKMKTKIVATTLLLVILFIQAYSQTDAIYNAFKKSYEQEAISYKDAIATMKTVFDEKSYEINLRLGWLNYALGQNDEAAKYYFKAMTLMPYSLEAKFGYINVNIALTKWDVVETQYKEVLKISPQQTVANYYLGLIYYNKKDYTNAEKYFSQNVNLYPFDYDSVIMLAWTNYFQGKTREAKVLFQKALLNRPDDKSASDGLKMIK